MWLTELAQQSDQELHQLYQSFASIREIRHKVDELEIALKSDLGIYAVEFSDITDGFQSYQDVAGEFVRQKTYHK